MLKISVIIPVYNVERWIRDCLDSLLVATSKMDDNIAVEAVCVDDGSTDQSGEIIDEYVDIIQGKDCSSNFSIRVIHQCNSGVGEARNLALKNASGEWIVFLDADDVVAPNIFACISKCAREVPDADMIGFREMRFDETGMPRWCNECDDKPYNVKDLTNRLRYAEVWRNMWNFCYRRTALPRVGFAPLSVGEDLLFMNQAQCNAKLLVDLSDRLYGYRTRNGSAMNSQNTLRKFRDHLSHIMQRIRVFSESDKNIDPLIYRRLGVGLIMVAPIFDISSKDQEMAWRAYWESMRWRKEYRALPFLIQIMILVGSEFKSKLLARLLCHFPFELRKMSFKLGKKDRR